MKNFFRVKIFVIFFIMLLSACLVFLKFYDDIFIVQAGVASNVAGFAWSETIGWISFNSNDCDTNENGYIDTQCGGDDSTTQTFDYGVNLDLEAGSFSGYAWSSNIGWIDFAPESPYPKLPNNFVEYDSANNTVIGWAKILSLGDDGWIKMSDDSVENWDGKGVSIDPATGDFSGWAWNGNNDGTGIGWISFNCSNNSSCESSDYKVSLNSAIAIEEAITIEKMTAPNWSKLSACEQKNAATAILRWTTNSVDQVKYQVIINDSDNFDSSVYNSGVIDEDTKQIVVSSDLESNTTYYWWVKVWGENGTDSGWVQFNTDIAGHELTDNEDYNLEKSNDSSLTFTTYKHEFPRVYFSYPENISKDEEVQFTDESKYYLSSDPNTSIDCDDGNCKWSWTSTTGATISGNTTPSPTIIFNSTENQTVKLEVTDGTGYCCEEEVEINISESLPAWIEVK